MEYFELNSEVADSFIGFLNDDDPSLNSIDALFKNDIMDYNQPNVDPSAMAGFFLDYDPSLLSIERHRSCSNAYIQEQPPPLFQPNVDLNLSMQSTVAARKRRKRISEKTQELGRLIPGGAKMSTADMLQAAHKYIKFLQAQLGILRLMTSSTLECGSEEEEYLHVLLASSAVQERLAAEGMCILPSYVTP